MFFYNMQFLNFLPMLTLFYLIFVVESSNEFFYNGSHEIPEIRLIVIYTGDVEKAESTFQAGTDICFVGIAGNQRQIHKQGKCRSDKEGIGNDESRKNVV